MNIIKRLICLIAGHDDHITTDPETKKSWCICRRCGYNSGRMLFPGQCTEGGESVTYPKALKLADGTEMDITASIGPI
jgi:hypothetical protein